MSTNLSSNSLFHFTNSFDNLTSIIENGLFPRYVIEDYAALDSAIPRLAIPMICFCDIPLTHSLDHIGEYGKYGIGLSKEWALTKDLNPVTYLTTNAELRGIYDRLFIESNESNGFTNITNEIIKYIKPYRGQSTKNNKQKIFYDEKEWRFIYRNSDLKNFKPILIEPEFGQIKDHNTNIESYALTPNSSDVKYLIVNRRDEVYKLCDFIFESTPFKKQEKYKLMSCIISIEDIKEDF
ncbi:MAG: hypothetical protein J0L62_15305 [Bacteroidetes bacterium]|nr:hypothetical protein [Bacteroidota bacterium]